MRKLITWAIDNTPAMNTLMIAILAVGAFSLAIMHREMFPQFELEIVVVSVPYPGASPDEIEEGICQKIEEAVQAIEGIKKLSSMASEGIGTVIIELESSADPQKVLNRIDNEINRIPNFPPELAEEPAVQQVTIREAAISIGVIGPDRDDIEAELQLRKLAEDLRIDLKQFVSNRARARLVDIPEDANFIQWAWLSRQNKKEQARADAERKNWPAVNQVDILGGRDYQIDVEIPEENLRKYGMSLGDAAKMIRDRNLELPGGTMKTPSQEVLMRAKNKQLDGPEIAKLPLVTAPSGVVLTVDDLGTVRDAFVDDTAITRINGHPGLILSITKTASEDMLEITSAVREFVEQRQDALPPGYQMIPFSDTSVHVKDRLILLLRNGFQGLVLVFIILGMFRELRLAGWVAIGIPISMLGAGILMLLLGQTLNMLSMFAFILTLGILVDDAVVVGENIYHHRGAGKSYRRAAIDGTVEVMPSICASVTTTIMAFTPMLMVPGMLGKFIQIIPIAVIAMLAVSLFEGLFILPCHLAHKSDEPLSTRFKRRVDDMPKLERSIMGTPLLGILYFWDFMNYPIRRLYHGSRWVNEKTTGALTWFSDRLYIPLLRRSLNWPSLTVAIGVTILLLTIGSVLGGFVPYTMFPKGDAPIIDASITYPSGTPASVTNEATRLLEQAMFRVNEKAIRENGTPVLKLTFRMVGAVGDGSMAQANEPPAGSHRGRVSAELTIPEERPLYQSDEILKMWREEAGTFAGVDQLTFTGREGGPGGRAIEFKLLARPENMGELEEAVELCKAKLATLDDVIDVIDDSTPGKPEFQITVKDSAKSLGISERDLGNTIRASYYGEEVMRLQRGRHEVKLMVRYPESERRSLGNFDNIRVRTGERAERPLSELADVKIDRTYSRINRLNQLRSIMVGADCRVMSKSKDHVATMAIFIDELLQEDRFKDLSVDWGGQAEQNAESIAGLMKGLGIALIAMFGLLTLEFRSYLQPIIILCTIPFGVVGAIFGHWFMGLDVTIMSLFGLVALSGVVINDSIVLIDFINHRVRDGEPIMEALLDAGRRRLRPVLLTSATTVFGLMPLLRETSFQAKFLIPMAVSLSFGLIFTTALVLLFVPTFYLIYYRISGGVAVLPHEGDEQLFDEELPE